jgi:carbonic anhydrase/acetyltransferase-like protein (isoleucine patch superfamily)
MLKRLEKGVTAGKDLFIAEGAVVLGEVYLGDDVSIWYNAVIRGDVDTIHIGNYSNVQDGSVIHVTKDKYPTKIGEFVTIGHGVILHGCEIGDTVLVGIGAIILDNAKIGSGSIVAAGSVVPPNKVFPERSMIMGNPAKVTRQLTDDDVKGIRDNALHYVEYKKIYMSSGN